MAKRQILGTLRRFLQNPTGSRLFATGKTWRQKNQPLSANDLPRPAGICSMFRLPVQAMDTTGKPSEDSTHSDFIPTIFKHKTQSAAKSDAHPRYARAKARSREVEERDAQTKRKKEDELGQAALAAEALVDLSAQSARWTDKGLDVCFVGVPIDSAASNRPGTRFGPRQIRTESVLVRTFNKDTGASPYSSLQVADVGDVYITMYDLKQAVVDIRGAFAGLIENGCKTIAMGGDHSVTYPILQAYAAKYGPLGLVHVDAHLDLNEHQNNCPIVHGTPFRRAWEEGLLDCKRVVQIGLRGSGYVLDDYAWPISQGFRVVPARHCYHKSLTPLMKEVRAQMGDAPVYLSFDIDALDPAYAPGTGTPEIGGLTSVQAMELIWGCKGLNIVGADMVEVSPPYDPSGTTALTAANLMFEMLCVLPGVKYEDVII